jgi:hypothetical protein
VLVHRVLVVEVAHDPPRDRLKLREDATEQAAVVHLRQPRVQPGLRLEQPQRGRSIALLGKEVVRAIAIDVLLDARQRFFGDLGARVDGGLKGRYPGRRRPGSEHRVQETNAVA